MKKALYAGSFDPFTNGHLDIVKRALKIFDELTVLIAISPSKRPLFSTETRKEILEDIFANEKQVKVDTFSGLIVDYAKKNDIYNIVRGLRPTGDFDNEFQMASMNKHLFPELDTVFLTTGANLYFISSSLIKEIYQHGGEISDFVPTQVLKAFNEVKK